MEERRMGDKSKKNSAFKNYRQANKRRREYNFFKGTRSFIGIILCAILLIFLMSGIINQRKTGETMINYFLHIGRNIGNGLNSVADGGGPIKFTEDGIYLQNAQVSDDNVLEDTYFDKEKIDNYSNNTNNDTNVESGENIEEN